MSTRDIAVRFLGDASNLVRASDQAGQATNRFSDRTRKMAKAAGIGALAVGGVLVKGLADGVAGIREGEEAEAKFNDALSRAPKAIQASTDALMANAEAAQKHTRFSYEDTLAVSGFLAAQDGVAQAVANGTTTMEEATNVTLDLATALGVDGPAAAKTLAKMLNAPEKATAALRKAGVDLTAGEEAKLKAWSKAGNTAAAQGLVMDKLKGKTEGAAKAAGETTEGQMIRAKAAFGEVQESLAAGLIPVLTKFLGWGVAISNWAQENPGKMKAIVIVVGALAAIIGTASLVIAAWNAWVKVAAASQLIWNAVMSANPIALVVLAIVGLIAIFVLAWKKSETFRAIVTGAFNAVKRAASAVWNWIKSNWPLLLAIITGPIGLAVLAIVKNWDKIKAGATKVKDWIVEKFNAIVSFVTGLPGKIGSAAAGMWDGIKNAFRGAINFIIGAWNRLEFKIPGFKVGPVGFDGFTLGLPDIPMLAKGGTAYGGRAHIVGEAGPELFVPGRTGTVVPNHALGGGGDVHVRVFIGDRELTDLVRVERERADRGTRNAVMARAARSY